MSDNATYVAAVEEAFYVLMGNTTGYGTSAAKSLAKVIGYNVADYVDPSLSQLAQEALLASTFTGKLLDFASVFHHRGQIVFIIASVYLGVSAIAYIYLMRNDYIKNSCVYNTILSMVGSFILFFSACSQLADIEKFNCPAAQLFINVGVYLWLVGTVNRCIALLIRSRLAALHTDRTVDIEKNIWVRMARLRLSSDVTLFKLASTTLIISFIPGIVVLGLKKPNHFNDYLRICMNPPSWYTFVVMLFFAGIISFVFFAYMLRKSVNDIYKIKYQLYAYCFFFPAIGLPLCVAILSPPRVALKFLNGYFSIFYLILLLCVIHQSITVVFPVAVLLWKHFDYKRRARALKRRDFTSFAKIVLDDIMWRRFCDFSIRCFTEENSIFIRRYEDLLNAMRQNGRIFCATPDDESYAFHDLKSALLEKVKKPSSFNARYQCLFTIDLPLDRILIFDVEPAEAEKEILNSMYDDFFTENAPYELNIPSEVMKKVRGRFANRELTCLMLEETKNLVINMLYENTYAKFTEQSSNIINGSSTGYSSSYDSHGNTTRGKILDTIRDATILSTASVTATGQTHSLQNRSINQLRSYEQTASMDNREEVSQLNSIH